ncbi:hypothetical protein [Hymenobacter elongatus]|uniref:Rubredoxin-like domain-containing protein n=1 Tax=Hymenobacter elongatus TaxID=877208 RepID=A0A4Z0PNL1_9BACT|nr:hypothetical protein [Hymenobacter elongatus]TGE18578.1 hypothetical protein E5J99_04550 [Hymenobacter elongatus]
MAIWYCRVCGLDYDVSPWGPQEAAPDYSTCACCGVVFGYDDQTAASATAYRNSWLEAGGKWFYPRMQPSDWQLQPQLAQIPEPYR